ncbi:hypothetical protein C8A03DRAFT_35925 [Achaetomium macrosporum]|uniref:Secreted protein n=1 Tax=Achaetomium macrosporum TaxID=79813 RepID=A0AAN7C694_9PEZI|nr:hypothetical protein C8A03DRAFT_35925 [Achaetomium macrosporum]
MAVTVALTVVFVPAMAVMVFVAAAAVEPGAGIPKEAAKSVRSSISKPRQADAAEAAPADPADSTSGRPTRGNVPLKRPNETIRTSSMTLQQHAPLPRNFALTPGRRVTQPPPFF